MLPSPKQDGWHALVCCDSHHGSSSMAATPASTYGYTADGDVVMADGAVTVALMPALSASTSPSTAPPSTTSVSASAATSTTSASAPAPAKCASPCPFETYCCLDEHCAADCIKTKAKSKSQSLSNTPQPECQDADCAEACFDPNCDDGCEAECCDNPDCESEWCVQGCTIEEYVSLVSKREGRC